MTDTPISDGSAQSTAGIYRVPASKGPFTPGSKAYLQHNFAGTAAPGTGDDSADGYAVGSLWFDTTNGNVYIAKTVGVGTASWTRVQNYDADLETIAGLTATTDNFLQAKSSAWASRTPAQVKDDLNDAVGKGIRVLGASAVAASVSSGTSEVTLATITVPANAMGANGRLRITTEWTYTNGSNNKTLRVKFGGQTWMQIVATTTAHQKHQIEICNVNATNIQKSFVTGLVTAFGSSANSIQSGAADTTTSLGITITGQPATGGETITLESYLVELIRP